MIQRALKSLLALAALALLLLPTSTADASQGSLCLTLVGPVTGVQFTQNVNTALAALVSANSGAVAPTNPCGAVPVTGQFWIDTSTTPNVAKLYDGTNWETLGTFDTATGYWTPVVGGGNPAAAVASAATTDLWSVPQSYVSVTGVTGITRLAGATATQGSTKFIRFTGVLTLTYDATKLILPGLTNITTAVGDTAQVVALGSSNAIVVNYTTASGLPAALSNVNNTSDANKPVSTAQAAAILVAQQTSVGYNAQTGTTYTLVIGDAGKLVSMSNVSANTLTVPPNSSVAFPLYSRIDLAAYGAGQTTIAAGVGVTIRSTAAKLKLNVQYSGGTLIKIGTDEWMLFGDLA